MKTHTLTCPDCGGKGTIPMPVHLQEVLDIVRKNPGVTSHEVRPKLKDKITNEGTSNRLTDLLALKLVKRQRNGKFFHYTAV